MKLLIVDENIVLNEDTLLKQISEKYPELEIVSVNTSSFDALQNVDYWNTLLIYRFNETEMSPENHKFIEEYWKTTNNTGTIFPISYGTRPIPPNPLEKIKANSIADSNADFNIVNRIGSFLGLTCLGKDHTIFVSHRAIDGKQLAEQTCEILEKYGFKTWRDEARDSDGEGPIRIGQEAQEIIESNLKKCTAIILIDTPRVAESPWVKKEIDIANSELIPILPVCFRDSGDKTIGPRFQVLRNLSRWLDIQNNVIDERIPEFLSEFLIDIYQRKREMPGILSRVFQKKGFSWSAVDERKHYFSSSKTFRFFTNHILSHSPIHKGLYPPYIKSFGEYQSTPANNFNRRLLIYDGDPMNEHEVQDLKEKVGAINVDILHHQNVELALEQL